MKHISPSCIGAAVKGEVEVEVEGVPDEYSGLAVPVLEADCDAETEASIEGVISDRAASRA